MMLNPHFEVVHAKSHQLPSLQLTTDPCHLSALILGVKVPLGWELIIYYIIIYIYIIINITLIQWGMFMNVPHLHPLMVLAILRVQRSSWSHQGLSFQLGGFHRWDPMALLPAAGVHRLHLPLPIDDHFLDPTDGNQGLVKWEPKGWAISKFN